jgi:hypothetical protein
MRDTLGSPDDGCGPRLGSVERCWRAAMSARISAVCMRERVGLVRERQLNGHVEGPDTGNQKY